MREEYGKNLELKKKNLLNLKKKEKITFFILIIFKKKNTFLLLLCDMLYIDFLDKMMKKQKNLLSIFLLRIIRRVQAAINMIKM